ncbi:MAG TPA: hypothetical protein ENN25_06675, partial [Euryarchaeota archaeon]|nr:hypothetical protein [Euryarchaeota archaeon]
MGMKIAVSGKGGVGKTTVAGAIARYWANSTSDVYYQYDSSGRLIHKNDGDYWTYIYDSSGHLIEVEKDNSTVSEFTYDAFGRRIKK